MHDVEAVQVGQGMGDLDKDGPRLFLRVALLLEDGVEELGAAGIFQDEDEGAGVLENSLQADDVGVLQPLHNLHLAPKSCLVEILPELEGPEVHELDGEILPGDPIRAPMDHAEGPPADLFVQGVEPVGTPPEKG